MRGHSGSNTESWNELETVMESDHPRLVVLYLGDTDGAGHSGDWELYLQTIRNADEIVGTLWNKIQSDPIYQNKTTLIVTNDHGRHDDLHGGFKEHGDNCGECQHIMFFTIGPDFKKDFQVDTKQTPKRTLIDITPTIGKLLGFNPEYSKGKIMSELFTGTPIPDQQSMSTDEDTQKKIILTARDPDGDKLTFKITDNPLNGNLSGYQPEIIYTPNADFNREDCFTFTASDGNLEGIPAKVSITVKPYND